MTALPSAFFLHVVQRVMKRLTVVLDREVDDRRRAAKRRGHGSRLEIVGRCRAAKRHVEMSMAVDAARDHIPTCRVERLVGRHRQIRADRRDGVVFDEDIPAIDVARVDDGTVLDQ